MRPALVALAIALASNVAHAEQQQPPPTPYVYTSYFHTFAGFGYVPGVDSPFLVTTIEIGRHPFGGAFSAGGSASFVGDPHAGWYLGAGGIQMRLDLTYVFLSGLWAQPFDPCFPVHVVLGARLGVAYSTATALNPPYNLFRFELQPELDVEVPFALDRKHQHQHSVVLRGALDTSMSLDGLFRWSILLGYGIAWGVPQ